jgi:NAD(P)-dependent dehydrogenase (short-subunit alcohol dehydrogenase family)
VIGVDVRGVFLCSKAVVAHMADHGGGSMVNIASVAGQVAVKRRFAYGASKGAVIVRRTSGTSVSSWRHGTSPRRTSASTSRLRLAPSR